MSLKKIALAVLIATTVLTVSMLCPWKRAPMEGFRTGSIVVAERSVPIRQSPPKEGLFYVGKGAPVGHAQAGDMFRVGAVARVRKPMGDQIWLYVERMGGMRGWAYAGRSDSSVGNFSMNKVASK